MSTDTGTHMSAKLLKPPPWQSRSSSRRRKTTRTTTAAATKRLPVAYVSPFALSLLRLHPRELHAVLDRDVFAVLAGELGSPTAARASFRAGVLEKLAQGEAAKTDLMVPYSGSGSGSAQGQRRGHRGHRGHMEDDERNDDEEDGGAGGLGCDDAEKGGPRRTNVRPRPRWGARGRGWSLGRGLGKAKEKERPALASHAKTAGPEFPPFRRDADAVAAEGSIPASVGGGGGGGSDHGAGTAGGRNAAPSRSIPRLGGALDRGAELFSNVVNRGKMKRVIGCWVPLRDADGKVAFVVLVLVPASGGRTEG
ncbi:hypothetical protein VTK26DRAFT_6361 [Humicola hyalothermophila]